jgi:glucose/arabinose dehydrogenase
MLAVALAAGCSDDDEQGDTAAPRTQATETTAKRGAPPTGNGQGGVRLEKIGDFSEPLYVDQPPGSEDLYVVEQGGAVRIVRDGETLEEPFLDVSEEITSGGERGLLSIAFPPDHAQSGLFYVFFTDRQGDERIVEYARSADNPDQADTESRRDVLKIDDFASNHNGGLLLFGPDGLLYAGLGDGGTVGPSEADPERNGQDLNALLGKLLRIDPRPSGGKPYTVPNDNPFVGRPGARPEVYAYGLRNPWRYTFDPGGALVIADVGQHAQEEIDYLPKGEAEGANLGWSAFEGTMPLNSDQRAPGAVRPVLTYATGEGGSCSITGGLVVRDPGLPSLFSRYVYGDYCAPALRSVVLSGGAARDDRPLGVEVPSLTSFGEDNAGRVYATSQEGPVYRLGPE